MRILTIVPAVAACLALPAAAHDYVNLDRPGALATVQRDHPEHVARIARILRVADEMPCQTPRFGRVLKAELDVADARCALMLYTSFPAKRVLSFTLDDTQYKSVVTMRDASTIVPAR
jgi:hypothetical protein